LTRHAGQAAFSVAAAAGPVCWPSNCFPALQKSAAAGLLDDFAAYDSASRRPMRRRLQADIRVGVEAAAPPQ